MGFKFIGNKWFWVVMAVIIIFWLVIWFAAGGNVVNLFG